MRIRSKLTAVVLGLTLTLGLASLHVSGQEPKGKAEPGGHRLPPYFGQIGISEEQRQKIYEIQDKHEPKITELEVQIKAVREKMIKESESVLTEPQKKELEAKRKAGMTRGSRKGKKAAPKEEPKS